MASSTRKRRAQSDIRDGMPPQRRRTQNRSGGGGGAESSAQGARRNRRAPESPDADNGDVVMGDGSGDDGDGGHGEMQTDRLVKNLVRLALACEYSRQPIRRADISKKVLGHNGRRFKEIFDLAQIELRKVFGMEMLELPIREKTTLAQRRAAATQAQTDKGAASSKSYILCNILDAKYKQVDVIEPYGFKEQTYAGIVAFVVALIYLNGRSLPASKLDRYLRRLNAEDYTPIDKTETVLNAMVKHGYINRIKDNSGDVTSYEYQLGPRAKVEFGEEGVKGFVGAVFGDQAPKDLDAKVKQNMGIEVQTQHEGMAAAAAATAAVNGEGAPVRRKRGGGGAAQQVRNRPRRAAAGDDSGDDDDFSD